MENIQILIIDYGSQYTLVIGRTLRELGFRSAILPPDKAEIFLKKNNPKGIILSGSNWSVHNEGAPQFPKSLDISGNKYPLLGICYGMQLLAYIQNGSVDRPIGHREYGPAKVSLDNSHPLFKNVSKKIDVWASHGDTIQKLSKGFREIANSKGIAGMSDGKNRVLGIQFHPEVVDTKEGKMILQNFLNICNCEKDWDPSDLIKEIQNEVLNIIKKDLDKKVILGLSGGVDSSTLAALLFPVLKEKLICIAIDTGGLRAGELDELKKNAKSAGILNLKIISAEKEFIDNISTTIDAQEKRIKFREIYTKIFEKEIKNNNAGFIIQGTLAADIIESGEAGQSAMIKMHHNVGLNWTVKDLHPFKNLFKYEVRELGKVLNLPSAIYQRNPFPGPGLYLRVVGIPVSKEHLDLVREVDQVVKEILIKNKLDKEISQLIVALWGVDSVGVKGDERVYGHSIVVRAVQTVDFMTATGYFFQEEIAREIVSALVGYKNIVRVLFDITPKPPATTEFE